MMTQPAPFSFSTCVPVPRLHAALGCGVAQAVGDCPPWNAPEQPALLQNLPMSRAEARAFLQDIHTAPPEELSRAVHMAAAEYVAGPLDKCEDAALSAFMQQNSAPPVDAAKADRETDAHRRLAQRHLLTVWTQEERVLDIVQLTSRCETAERRLADLLHDPEFAENDENLSTVPDTQTAKADLPAEKALADALPLLPPWRFVLAKLLPFLPYEALLVINDAAMAEAVRATPEPESIAISGVHGQAVRIHIRHLVPEAAEGTVYTFLLPALSKTS